MLRAASRTRARVASEIRAPAILLRTSETLDCETPAIAATSVIVGRFLYPAASGGADAPERLGREARVTRLDFSAKSSIPPSRLCAASWLCAAIVIFFYLTDNNLLR